MRFNTEHHDQIAGNTAHRRGLPEALFLHIAVGIHTRGNVERNRSFLALVALALTIGAFFFDLFTRATAIGTNALTDRAPEHSVLHLLHHTATLTFSASCIFRATFRARTAAGRTGLVTHIGNRLFTTLCRVHKRERHFPLNVFAHFASRRSCTAAKATEATAENIAKNIGNIFKTARSAKTAKTAHSGVFELVIVRRAFLRIGKRFVRFVDLLKFFRRFRVTLVSVGVIFHSKLPIRRFDFVRACLFIHTENFVIILLICHFCIPYGNSGLTKSFVKPDNSLSFLIDYW